MKTLREKIEESKAWYLQNMERLTGGGRMKVSPTLSRTIIAALALPWIFQMTIGKSVRKMAGAETRF